MPRIFRTLGNITVWILFIIGCLAIVVQIPIIPYLNGGWEYLAIGVISLFLSVVAMKLIKTLE